jgi:hypothetical protein
MASSSGSGSVRRTPIPALRIIAAAAMPVMSESCAFQSSAGRGGRRSSRNPSPSATTSWSGRGRLAPPRSRSSASRRVPTSLSSVAGSATDGSAPGPPSAASWTAA